MQSDRNASHPNCNWSNEKTPKTLSDASHPYVPLPGFWLSGRGLCSRWLLQSVAICYRRGLTAKNVADCYKRLQSVAIRENLADWASRCVPPIALVDEGANRNRWTRIHRPVAEKQVRTWSTCAPSFPPCPAPTRGWSSRLGTKLRGGWQGA